MGWSKALGRKLWGRVSGSQPIRPERSKEDEIGELLGSLFGGGSASQALVRNTEFILKVGSL